MARVSKRRVVVKDEVLVKDEAVVFENECKNSGLFKIDAYGISQSIFKLTDKKEISKHKTWDNVPWLDVQRMERGLTGVLSRYRHEDGSSIEQSIILEEQDSFRRHMLSAIEAQPFLSLEEIGPMAEKLIRAGQARIKRNVRKDNFKVRTIEREYNDLIDRCLRIFKEYIPLPETRGRLDFHEDYFHYVAHFLIGIRIAKNSKRGHQPVFEKIKTYYNRKNQ